MPLPAALPIAGRVAEVLRRFAAALNGDNGRTLSAMIGLAEWDEDVFAALQRMTAVGPKLLRDVLVENALAPHGAT